MFEEKGCLELFIYNSERLLLVEENLGYFQNQSAALEQFNLIEYAKIGDIVNLVKNITTFLVFIFSESLSRINYKTFFLFIK